MEKLPRYCSVKAVAAAFGMSAMTLYRAINAGEFPAVRIRGRLLIPEDAVTDMTTTAIENRRLVDAADWVG